MRAFDGCRCRCDGSRFRAGLLLHSRSRLRIDHLPELALSTLARCRPDYFEVDIDVGSSALATYATHLAGRYAKNIVLNLAFGLQVS